MFDVSYHKSFLFLVITISNALSVVSRLYFSYKLINFELDENSACFIVHDLIRTGIASPGLDTSGAWELQLWVMLSSPGWCSAPLARVLPLRVVGFGDLGGPQPGSWCGQWKYLNSGEGQCFRRGMLHFTWHSNVGWNKHFFGVV